MILLYFIGFSTLLYILYCVLPICYLRLQHYTLKHLPIDDQNIFLTIDDGPDVRYTDIILKLLKKYEIKATFFVVAQKAVLNKNIIQRMLEDGHAVALHSLEHKSVWLKGWRYIKEDFAKSDLIMKSLRCKPIYYRPPWGHINLTSMVLAKKYGMKILLWDVLVQDWKKISSALLILGKLFQRTKSNSVICLHDSAEEIGAAKNAPERTIKALQVFIPAMLKEGYHFVLPNDIIK